MESVKHDLFRFFICHFHIDVLDKRRIQIVHMHFIKLQHFFAQSNIPLQQTEISVHRLHELVVHFFRNVVCRKGSFTRRMVMADLRYNIVLFHLAAERARKRVGEFFVGRVQFLECLFAHAAVFAFQQACKAAVRDLHFIAVFIDYCRELKVCIVEHAESGAGSIQHFRNLCEQCFFFLR